VILRHEQGVSWRNPWLRRRKTVRKSIGDYGDKGESHSSLIPHPRSGINAFQRQAARYSAKNDMVFTTLCAPSRVALIAELSRGPRRATAQLLVLRERSKRENGILAT
jgi:hypothetical protein